MTDRRFIEKPDDPAQYPWVIWSRKDHFDQNSLFIERMDSEERALALGRTRHEAGYVVSVFYEIAHTEGA